MDFKEKLKIYLVTAYAYMTAKTKEEKQEILKLLNKFEDDENGDK